MIFWKKRSEKVRSSIKLVARFPDCEFEVSIDAGDDYKRLLEEADKTIRKLKEVERND